jgi:hypothetical protein
MFASQIMHIWSSAHILFLLILKISVDGRAGFQVGSNIALSLGGHSIVYNYNILATRVTRSLPCPVTIGAWAIENDDGW